MIGAQTLDQAREIQNQVETLRLMLPPISVEIVRTSRLATILQAWGTGGGEGGA